MIPIRDVPFIIDEIRRIGLPERPGLLKHSAGLLTAIRPHITTPQLRAFRIELRAYGTEIVAEAIARSKRVLFVRPETDREAIQAIRDRMPPR